MKVKTVDDWSEFLSLREQWNLLLRESDHDSIFLSWEWIWNWSQIRLEAIEPYVLTIYEDELLVGIAPFYTCDMTAFGTVKLKTLRVLGDYGSAAEYPNFISKASNSRAIKTELVNELLSTNVPWDCIWLNLMAGWTTAYDELISVLMSKPQLFIATRQTDFSYIDISQREVIEAKLNSGNLGSNLRRFENGIKKLGVVDVQYCEDLEEADYFFNTLTELHKSRWAKKSIVGTFERNPQLAEFYRLIIRDALQLNILRFAILTCDGVPRAAQIGYAYEGVFHVIQEGFDPEFHPGVGNLLRKYVLESCLKEGLKEYDFLQGASEHKRRWGAVHRQGYDVIVWRSSLKTLLLKRLGLWPTGRYLNMANK